MKIDATWIGLGALALVGGVILYNNQGLLAAPVGQSDERVVTTPDRVPACNALSGEARARVESCLTELRTVKPSAAASAEIKKLSGKGKVLVFGGDVAAGVETIDGTADKELFDALMGQDEQAVSKMLRAREVRVLIVHRDLKGALDRDGVALSRLVQHDFLEWHQLRYVTEELMVYTVRSSLTRVPLKTGDELLKGLRARLEQSGQPIPQQSWKPAAVRLMGVMRLQGQTLVVRHSVGTNIERVLDELAAKLAKRWQREVAIDGHGNVDERIKDTRLEVHIVMERAPVEPRSRFAVFDLWEMGVDGMMFRQRPGVKDEKFTYLPGSELTTHSWKSADKFLRESVKTGGWHDRRPWEDPRTRLDIIRTQHFMERERGGGPAVRLIRGLPEVTRESITDDVLRQMLVDGGEWWLKNQKVDGSYNYKFWPTQNRQSTEYNEVRHILGPRDLADTWRYRPDDRYLKGARHGMEWLLRSQVHDTDVKHKTLLHPPEGTMLFRVNNNQKLGTVAVALLAWVEWAKASGDHSQDENIRKMARFTLSRNLENGKFDPYYVPRNHPYYGNVNDIVPGEAALALGEVAEYFGEHEPWLDFWPKYQEYYEPWFEKRKARKQEMGRWPTSHYTNSDRLELVQFGPWSVMAARQYYELTGDEKAAAFGLKVADWMIDEYQWQEDRTPFPDYIGGYYKMREELPAMQTFCYSEGTAAAYRIAAKYSPETKDKYDKSTRDALRFLKLMQYDDINSYYLAERDLIHGGVKYTMNENKIRTDYVGHGLSTISQYLDARDFDPAIPLRLSPIDMEGPPNPQRVDYVKAQKLAAESAAQEEAAGQDG